MEVRMGHLVGSKGTGACQLVCEVTEEQKETQEDRSEWWKSQEDPEEKPKELLDACRRDFFFKEQPNSVLFQRLIFLLSLLSLL